MNLSRIPVWLKRCALLALLMLTAQECVYTGLSIELTPDQVAPTEIVTLRLEQYPLDPRQTIMIHTLTVILPEGVELVSANSLNDACELWETTDTEVVFGVDDGLAPNPMCVVELQLRATAPGIHTISIERFLFSLTAQSEEEVDTVTLNVAGQILASAAFSPSEIQPEQTSTLTFTLTNDSSITVTGMQVDLPLPAGLRLAGNRTSDCGGRFSETAGGLMLTDVTLPARASCRITAPVTGSAGGTYTFASSYVSANEFDYSNQATAALTILMPTPTHTPPPVVVDQPVVSNPPISTPIPVCGNSVCEISSGENYGTCAFDCSSSCGDLYCDAVLHEDASWCPSDCTP